jgi:hypothetical protein
MNAPLEPAHSPFGGSVAVRVLRCPAFVGLVAKVPADLRRSSVYADRGTALHSAIALLLGDDPPSLESLVGKTFNGYTITSDDVETALGPAYAYAATLIDTPGAVYYLERRVDFPTIPGAFGTADLIVRIGSTIYIIDFKFGSGVRVLALYPDGDEDVINAQLLVYAAAARPEFFAGVDNIVLTIVQPASIEPDAEMVSSVTITHAELDEFVAVYRAACAEALSEAPRLEQGPWCRFCAAKPICPEHTKPLLDLAQLTLPAPAQTDYLQVLAHILTLVDAVKDIGKAAHDQAKAALHAGAVVPGYALTPGRAERHWHGDEPAAIAALQSLGLHRDDIIAESMRSVKQIEIRAKARGLKIPQELIASRRSGVSLVRHENVRVSVRGRDEIARAFAAELEAFQQQGE